MTTIYDFEVQKIDGRPLSLADFRGQVLLVVNTASRCGFTPQFAGLQALHRRFHERGFTVIGFPCNQFGGQDPGSNAEIGAFCAANYGVDFPMMARIEVKGAQAAPLYRWLTRERPGLLGTRAIKWNFTKFLVGRDGRVLRRHAPMTKPEAIAPDVEKALAG